MPSPAVIADYKTVLMNYWQQIGRTDGQPWDVNTAGPYSRVYYPDTKPVAASQGFVVDK